MKFSIKNLFATALTLVVLTGSAFASTTNPSNNVTVLSQVKNIHKIVVSGNVEVLLIQAPVESVKVYDSYYAKNALVQQQNGELRISLDVILKGAAKADIDANTINLTTTVKENASLELSGSTTDHYAVLSAQAKMNMDQFTAENTSVSSIVPVYAKAKKAKRQTLESIVLTDEFSK